MNNTKIIINNRQIRQNKSNNNKSNILRYGVPIANRTKKKQNNNINNNKQSNISISNDTSCTKTKITTTTNSKNYNVLNLVSIKFSAKQQNPIQIEDNSEYNKIFRQFVNH